MSDYWYFPSNLENTEDHIFYEKVFTIKSNSF